MSLRWAYIMSLTPDGAAERSGELRIGDQLVAIAGQSVIGLPVSQCMSILAAVEGAEVHRALRPRVSALPRLLHPSSVSCEAVRVAGCPDAIAS